MAIIPSTPLDRIRVIAGLLRLRRELEMVAEDEKLTLAETWQGMLLADVVQAIGLSPDEQRATLGFDPQPAIAASR